MRKITQIFTISLILCLSFVFFGCQQAPTDNDGESSIPVTEATGASTEATQPTTAETNPPDGLETYVVHVVDESGKPVTGGMIQFCLDSCMPCVVDAEGNATMKLMPANYKVSFTMLPAGYALAGEETEFYFAEGSNEMTIVLKAV